jgi:hypothetical protein
MARIRRKRRIRRVKRRATTTGMPVMPHPQLQLRVSSLHLS